MDLSERLRAAAELLPEGASITVPRAALLELARSDGDLTAASGHAGAAGDVDLTVQQVAQLLGRASSTIRTWLAAGDLPGAYRLRGREWRVPKGALRALQQHDAEQHARPMRRRTSTRAEDADLTAWRRHLPLSAGGGRQ